MQKISEELKEKVDRYIEVAERNVDSIEFLEHSRNEMRGVLKKVETFLQNLPHKDCPTDLLEDVVEALYG